MSLHTAAKYFSVLALAGCFSAQARPPRGDAADAAVEQQAVIAPPEPEALPGAEIAPFLKRNGISADKLSMSKNKGEYRYGGSRLSLRDSLDDIDRKETEAHETRHAWQDKKGRIPQATDEWKSPRKTWLLGRWLEADACGYGAFVTSAEAALNGDMRSKILNYTGDTEIGIAQQLYHFSQDVRVCTADAAPPTLAQLKAHYLREAFIPCLESLHDRGSYNEDHLGDAIGAAGRCAAARKKGATSCEPDLPGTFDGFLQSYAYPSLLEDPVHAPQLSGTADVMNMREMQAHDHIPRWVRATLNKIEKESLTR